MSYFAEIENGIVQKVIVADREFIDSGIVGDPSRWVETFTDNSLRVRYAGIGYEYHKTIDAFIPPKQFDSWSLNTESAVYESPVPMPKDGMYLWNEKTKNWIEISSPRDPNAASVLADNESMK